MTPAQRTSLIQRYAGWPRHSRGRPGPGPRKALQWRPAPGKWSVHEVIIHCADSETNAHMRIRYLIGEADPLIVGYDQDRWANVFGYHELPLEPALATDPRRPRQHRPAAAPADRGAVEPDRPPHRVSPSYGAEKWLEIYAEHLEVHARQIERNLEAWERRT